MLLAFNQVIQGIVLHNPSPHPTFTPTPKTKYEGILSEFPAVMQSCYIDWLVKHDVTHHITITGPLDTARTRRLAPERLHTARQELDHMLERGTIQLPPATGPLPSHGAQEEQ